MGWSPSTNQLNGAAIGTVATGGSPVGAGLGGALGNSGNAATGAYRKIFDPGYSQRNQAEDEARSAGEQQKAGQYGVLNQMRGNDADYEKQLQGMNTDYQHNRNKVSNQLNADTASYARNIGSNEDKFTSRQTDLMNEAEGQAKDAQSNYSNTIQPRMKSIMEDYGNQASQAMSLKDAGDMNNSVQQGVRGFYENQAQGEGRQGLADVGVLSALGAQATAGQMGTGMPMTGSQLGVLSGQNMAQAGSAYGKTQQRIQSLRDQGIQQGLAQSNAQYDRGVAARNANLNATQAYQQAGMNNQNSQQNYRGERSGFSGDIANSQANKYNTQFGADQSVAGNRLGDLREDYGMNTGLANAQYGNAQNRGLQEQDIVNNTAANQRGIASQMGTQADAANAARFGQIQFGTKVASQMAAAGGGGAPAGGGGGTGYSAGGDYNNRYGSYS